MNQKLEQLIANIGEFLRDEAYPLEQTFLQQPFKELLPLLEAKRTQVKAAGMWAPHLPKEYGGLGLTLSEFARISEELGRTPIGHYLFNCQAPDIGNTEILIAHGTDDLNHSGAAQRGRASMVGASSAEFAAI